MILPLILLSLGAHPPTAPECRSCSEESKQLMSDVCFYMDEFTPDIETIEEIFEEHDLGPFRIFHKSQKGAPAWYAALIPSLGIKIIAPSSLDFKKKTHWELFLIWKISR